MVVTNQQMADISIKLMTQFIEEIHKADPEGATPRQFVQHLANMVVSTFMTIADEKLAQKGTNHQEMMNVLLQGFMTEIYKQFKFQTENKNQGLE